MRRTVERCVKSRAGETEKKSVLNDHPSLPSEPVKRTRPCIENFLSVSRQCLKPRERPGLNVTLRMIDAAVDFICYNNGDRLARKKVILTRSLLREGIGGFLVCVVEVVVDRRGRTVFLSSGIGLTAPFSPPRSPSLPRSSPSPHLPSRPLSLWWLTEWKEDREEEEGGRRLSPALPTLSPLFPCQKDFYYFRRRKQIMHQGELLGLGKKARELCFHFYARCSGLFFFLKAVRMSR